ncbi:MAG: hypothetical protein UT89_C0006G0017 [Parcubacteria group bacterium GW2011_GWE1_40_20]|nr:MAG: hypothetical protein UT89_C0006G0017 [Parcubacteria group bacterium GW2011_GWE1_40_20]
MRNTTKIQTNFSKCQRTRRKEIMETLGNKLALAYLESLRGQKLDSRQVSNNLNLTK